MQDLGYESHNSLRILGSLIIYAFVYFLKALVFYPVVLSISKLWKVGKRYERNLRAELFFSELI